jgi:hypothetical protein
MFWADLSHANLIGGAFTAANSTTLISCFTPSCSSNFSPNYFPAAVSGAGGFVFVSNGGSCPNGSCNDGPVVPPWSSDGINYFSIMAPTYIGSGRIWNSPYPNGSIPVKMAYAIDMKIDDGLPMSGRVTSRALASGGLEYVNDLVPYGHTPYTTSTLALSTTCYDNGGTNGAIQAYSMGQNGGSGLNCYMTFQFQ